MKRRAGNDLNRKNNKKIAYSVSSSEESYELSEAISDYSIEESSYLSSDYPSEETEHTLDDDSVDNSYQEENDFELDTSLISNAIASGVKKAFKEVKKIPFDDLAEVIDSSIDKIKYYVDSAYVHAVPGDKIWEYQTMDDDTREQIPVMRAELTRIRKLMRAPTLASIISANIPDEDKKHAVALYDITQNMEPYTEAQYRIYQEISSILKSADGVAKETIDAINEEERRLGAAIVPEVLGIKKRIHELNASDKIKTKLYSMCNELAKIDPDTSEYSSRRSKLVWAVNLPYQNSTQVVNVDPSDKKAVQEHCAGIMIKLNSRLHGMIIVKERLLQDHINRMRNPKAKSMLGLCSPPGRGKTAIASAWAAAVGLPFERISLGGVRDSTLLKGSDNVWLGSEPSIILQILRKMTVCDGVVLLDEMDKLGDSPHGKEIQHALLHITDYTQNEEFQDAFLNEFSHDISRLRFIIGMNHSDWLDPALADRIDILNLPDYTTIEIDHIVINYFLPKAIANAGMEANSLTIKGAACIELRRVLSTQLETEGLRPIERAIESIVSKVSLWATIEDSIKLSFKVPGFTGYPYEITPKTVNELVQIKRSNVNTYRDTMYM